MICGTRALHLPTHTHTMVECVVVMMNMVLFDSVLRCTALCSVMILHTRLRLHTLCSVNDG